MDIGLGGVVVCDLDLNLLICKSKHFIFVPNCTGFVNLVKF